MTQVMAADQTGGSGGYTCGVTHDPEPRQQEPRAHLALRRWLREPVNAITHFVGFLLSLVGTAFLVVGAATEPWKVTAFAIYGASSAVLYAASTLLHALDVPGKAEEWLRRADHAAIFVLIAGSYTPLALVSLRPRDPGWGWTLVMLVWILAACGVTFKLAWFDAPRWVSTAFYLAMGWLALVAIQPLARVLGVGGMLWLGIAGVIYSAGAVVYARKWPSPYPAVFGYHEIWHLFVLAGSACLYLLMLLYVLPS